MEQKTFWAVLFSFVILLGWSLLFPPAPAKKAPAPALEASTTANSPVLSSNPNAPGTVPISAASGTPEVVEAPAQDIVIETDYYRAVLDSRGAIFKSFLLKRYHHHKPSTSWLTVAPFLTQFFGQPASYGETENNFVQMIKPGLLGSQPLHLQFEENTELAQLFRQTVFSPNQENLKIEAQGTSQSLVLTSPVKEGVQIIKTLKFHPSSYVIQYSVSVINRQETIKPLKIRHLFGEGRVHDASFKTNYSHIGAIYLNEGKVHTEDSSDLEKEMQFPKLTWLGMEDQYFITAVQPISAIQYGFFQAQQRLIGQDKYWEPSFGVVLPAVELQPQKQVESEFQMYFGPKEDEEMLKFGKDLHLSHQMTLESLARPLLALLRWIYSYVGNYGIAIILLTVIVRLVLFPLTYKGTKTMKRMQLLQPKMLKLREKYKDNKEQLNREVIELYRKYKVNPVGGCLPLLLQIPIFFALYSALSSAVELRHAPFYGWLLDLSAPDGLGVTPIVMGLTMYILQKLTPTGMMDPLQVKVMNMLPLIFTVFTFTFPSGLTIYWVTSNLLSIAQQKLLNRIQPPDMKD